MRNVSTGRMNLTPGAMEVEVGPEVEWRWPRVRLASKWVDCRWAGQSEDWHSSASGSGTMYQ
jgi:hypothetical protein